MTVFIPNDFIEALEAKTGLSAPKAVEAAVKSMLAGDPNDLAAKRLTDLHTIGEAIGLSKEQMDKPSFNLARNIAVRAKWLESLVSAVTLAHETASAAPEINPVNYTDEQVIEINSALTTVCIILGQALGIDTPPQDQPTQEPQ
jgi:hypothetical protein